MKYKYIICVVLIGFILRMSYRLRSPLARAIYDKMEHQNEHLDNDHKEWYSVNLSNIDQEIAEKFVQLSQDKETLEFLQNCFTKSEWLFTQVYHGVAKSLLTWFISATSANGLLQRGSMFVLSSEQISQLTGWKIDESTKNEIKTILDLGAGDGEVTKRFAGFFTEVHGTETSNVMRWRLSKKGVKVIPAFSWHATEQKYDAICCLNLLDRCDRPLSMLADIHAKLRPDSGLLILALVFPIKQYVEDALNNEPEEYLKKPDSKIWEVQLNYFIREVLLPHNFELVSWSRVPYLCEGDFSRAFYVLNDVVMVLKPIPMTKDGIL